MNFKNTEIAYKHKSIATLKKELWIFRLISNSFFVGVGKVFINLFSFLKIRVDIFVGFMFNHFCGGKSLFDVVENSKKLFNSNVYTIPDYSVEAGSKISHEEVVTEILDSIKTVSKNKSLAFAVFKPTAIIESDVLLSDEHKNDYILKDRFNKIFKLAKENNVRVLVDAEDYKFQNKIDKIVEEFILKYNKEYPVVYQTLQMYRKDRLNYLNHLLEIVDENNIKLGLKFVRGAYMEKERNLAKINKYPDPINDTKKDTDNFFNNGIETAVDNIKKCEIFCGTHNELSTKLLCDLMNQKGLSKDDKRVFFSQLYGMRDNISFNLANEGYNVAKYVPYGPVNEVMPYLIRRADENSGINSQSNDEIVLIKKELKRRKI